MKLSELCKEINLPQDVTERVLDEEKQMKAQNKNTVPTDLTSNSYVSAKLTQNT